MIRIDKIINELNTGQIIASGAMVDTYTEITHKREYDGNGVFTERKWVLTTYLYVYVSQSHYEGGGDHIKGRITEFDKIILEQELTKTQFDAYQNANFETDLQATLESWNGIGTDNTTIIDM